MAKVRVYELAKEFGVESKTVMVKLQEMGEFVRSASSTIEAPVVRRLKEAFGPEGGPAGRSGGRSGGGAPQRQAPRPNGNGNGNGNGDGQVREAFGRMKAGKAPADNDDAGAAR